MGSGRGWCRVKALSDARILIDRLDAVPEKRAVELWRSQRLRLPDAVIWATARVSLPGAVAQVVILEIQRA